MKIISTGNSYRIYDDSLKTHNELPSQAYIINFNPQLGFSLVEYDDIKITEKVYGIHQDKVNKVLKNFARTKRNLGIILSGDKGIGKSLFAKLLAEKAMDNNMPVIVVDRYYPGISNFLNQIQQEAVILFDEFDKTFGSDRESKDTGEDPQVEMLSLFDGVAQGKKLFIITCNDFSKLNEYLINRPGRFHYHFRFEYPNSNAITEYLTDKGISQKEINKVIDFSGKVKLNYDCLRAIAFELETGEPFETAITDLNILNLVEERYNVFFFFKNGDKIKQIEVFDMFTDEEVSFDISVPKTYDDFAQVSFSLDDMVFDYQKGGYIINSNNVVYTLDNIVTKLDKEDLARKWGQRIKYWGDQKLDYILIKPLQDKKLHYAI